MLCAFGAGCETQAPEVDHCVGPRTAATFSVHCVTLHRHKSHQNKLHKRSSFVSCEPHSVAMTLHYAVIETGVSNIRVNL